MYRGVYILALFVLFEQATSDEYAEVTKKCARETGYNLKKLNDDKKNEQMSRQEKCFITCISTASQILNRDGSLNVKGIITEMLADVPNKKKLVADIKTCGKLKNRDRCVAGFNALRCCDKYNIFDRIEAVAKDI